AKALANCRRTGVRIPMTVSGSTVGISLHWKARYGRSCRASSSVRTRSSKSDIPSPPLDLGEAAGLFDPVQQLAVDFRLAAHQHMMGPAVGVGLRGILNPVGRLPVGQAEGHQDAPV